MAILSTELIMRKSLTVDDSAANGGKMDNSTAGLVTTAQVGNFWDSVFKAERIAGSTKWRKSFHKVNNDDDLTLSYPQIWIDIVTPGDDWVTFFAGTQINTQGTDGANFTGAELHYGCATLQADVLTTASTVTVTVEDVSLITGGADEIFRDGDTIRITNKVDPTSGTGTEEIHVINGVPTNVGNDVTITIVGTLANDYSVASGTRVMSIYEPADVISSIDNWVETTTSGTYDTATLGNVVADNIGSIEEEYTIEFTDNAGAFTIKDAALVTVFSGNNTTDDAIPLNADNSKPLFTVLQAGWGGTWLTGETIVFQTHPASIPIWQQRVVPAGAGSLAGDKTVVAFLGESV